MDYVTIPSKALAIGDSTEYEGVKLTAVTEFHRGSDAKTSGLKYFMVTPKGVMGFKEDEASSPADSDTHNGNVPDPSNSPTGLL